MTQNQLSDLKKKLGDSPELAEVFYLAEVGIWAWDIVMPLLRKLPVKVKASYDVPNPEYVSGKEDGAPPTIVQTIQLPTKYLIPNPKSTAEKPLPPIETSIEAEVGLAFELCPRKD